MFNFTAAALAIPTEPLDIQHLSDSSSHFFLLLNVLMNPMCLYFED